MHKTMLATASAFALMLGTAALAQQATTDPGAQEQELHLQQDQQPGTAQQDQLGTQQDQLGTAMETESDEFGFGMGGKSYAELGDDEREGVSFAAADSDWEADDLIGSKVVDADGEEIGEVEDLIVADDDTIDRAVIKLSGDNGEERFVVVRVDELQRAEGDEAEELTLDRHAIDGDYFMGESNFEKEDGRWEPASL